jgi:hypothetical protein
MSYENLSSYQMVEIFSKIESFSSFDRTAPTWTPRLNKIIEILNDIGVSYSVKHFNVSGFERKFTNIYVSFDTESSDKGIVFVSHHDIVNAKSQNCQDNTASFCNLLRMIIHLKDNKPKIPVHFAIVDTEEHVNPYCCGSQVLSEDIKMGVFGNIQACVNLELTGLGKNIWVSSFESFEEETKEIITALNASPVSTPYNDAAVLCLHGVPAMCIGILPDSEFEIAISGVSYPKTWSLCHSMADTFDKISEEDMNLFLQKLIGLVI